MPTLHTNNDIERKNIQTPLRRRVVLLGRLLTTKKPIEKQSIVAIRTIDCIEFEKCRKPAFETYWLVAFFIHVEEKSMIFKKLAAKATG